MNKKCLLLGHKEYDITDSGYPVCERCNSHSYYDDWRKSAYLFKLYDYLRFKWIKFRTWYRLKYFNELPF